MSWRERAERIRKSSVCLPTEPTKAPSVSSGSEQNARIRNRGVPDRKEQAGCEPSETHLEKVVDALALRLQSIAETHGIDWLACLRWLGPEDIEASRPYLDSDDPREYEGIVTWLRVLADPSIVKIPPSTRDSPCS